MNPKQSPKKIPPGASLAIAGAIVMVIGLLTAILPASQYYYAIKTPFRAPFPTAVNGSVHKTVRVRGSGLYQVEMVCRPKEEDNGLWQEFMRRGPILPRTPCNIQVQIDHKGNNMYSEYLNELQIWGIGPLEVHWKLAYVELPESGLYDLTINNQSDMSFLQFAHPTVEMKIDGISYLKLGRNRTVGFIVGGGLFLLGMICFIAGVLLHPHKPVTTSANLNTPVQES